MNDREMIANQADMIIAGYSFSKKDKKIRILNLNRKGSAAVLDLDGNVLETSMPDIELAIVSDYYRNNREFLED